MKCDQREQKPRPDTVRHTGRVLPEVRQSRAFSAKDHKRRATERHHPDAARDQSDDDDIKEDVHRLRQALLPARGSGDWIGFAIEAPSPPNSQHRQGEHRHCDRDVDP